MKGHWSTSARHTYDSILTYVLSVNMICSTARKPWYSKHCSRACRSVAAAAMSSQATRQTLDLPGFVELQCMVCQKQGDLSKQAVCSQAGHSVWDPYTPAAVALPCM